jgi:hypothetical protein
LKKKLFKIFPNPSHDHIVVEGHSLNCTLTIYGPYGRMIRKIATPGLPVTIDISDMSKGIYVLKIVSNDNNKPKIVKLVRN